MGGDVFILGSGFSRAAHDAMPTVTELRRPLERYLETLGVEKRRALPKQTDVEGLLGFLAVEQPFLRSAENLENRALFLRTSEWLAAHLQERQDEATASALPAWLGGLVTRWHDDRSTVITLNYDTLVEATVMALPIKAGGSRLQYPSTYAVPIAPIAQRYQRGGISFGGIGDQETFALVKLHGSLNWYYSGADRFFGETIYDVESIVHRWDQTSVPTQVVDIGRQAPGLVPLVVPPTPTKSPFFENESIRALWTSARSALTNCSRVVAIGYSLPQADLTMRALLSQACEGKEIGIVNKDASAVDHYKSLLSGARVMKEEVGNQAVANFAAKLTNESG